MPTTTPLTDAINALTTYANSVTGASDTTLSDAVATLASGYGGGGGETLTHSWDFTQSTTDTVGGMVVTLTNCSLAAHGIYLNANNASAAFPENVFKANCRIEIDIYSYDRQGTTNGRAFMFTNNNTGIIYRDTNQWGAYLTNAGGTSAGWNMFTDATSPTYFDGHTLKLVSDAFGYVSIYRDNDLIMTSARPMTGQLLIGSAGNTAYDLTISALRIYENV